MSAKLPYPANLEAEQAVLGSILIDPELMTAIDLSDADFFSEQYQAVFRSMRQLWDSGMPIDYTMLVDEIERSGKLGDVVNTGDLTGLLDCMPTAIYGPHYAAIVKRASIARQYVRMAQKIVEMAIEDQNVDALYSWIMEQVAIINSGQSDDKALLLWQESFGEFQRILQQDALRRENGELGFSWPWHSWMEILGEPQPGGVVLMAGATGTGKTTFAECICEHWARIGKKVVLVHLELNRKVMLSRRMARHTGIDFRAIAANKLADSQRRLMALADEDMQAWIGNIHYLHAPGWTAERIVKELSRLNEQGMCEGFVVDYMQKLQASQTQVRMYRSEPLRWAADDAERLKNLAEQRELISAILSQFTKEGQECSFDELDYTKLRGTQEIADKVNQIALFHRQKLAQGRIDEAGQQIVAPGGRDLIVRTKFAKNTFGPEGTAEQTIVPDQFNVFDMEVRP